MSKRAVWLVLALLLLVPGCGGQAGDGGTETATVDLAELYAGMEESCGWEEGYMVDVEGELLEDYYPGLGEISTKQLIAKVPLMSSAVNEIVLLQCETAEDAESAAAILQERADSQAEGGAWYPESMEAWGKAKVFQQGTYAALIASGEFQQSLEEQFEQAFS